MTPEEVIAKANRTNASDPNEAVERLAVSPLHRLSLRSMAHQQLALS
ncbi:MAG TPA: hypothetical protein VME22_21030 [Solirubrobacteraceae bacterium]|nr:hypothetical protein [Solirubrobacteraceae bacterium]